MLTCPSVIQPHDAYKVDGVEIGDRSAKMKTQQRNERVTSESSDITEEIANSGRADTSVYRPLDVNGKAGCARGMKVSWKR